MSSNFHPFSSAAPSDPSCYNELFSQPGVDETSSFFDFDAWMYSRGDQIDKDPEDMEFNLGTELCSFQEPPSYSDFALEEPFLATEPSDAPVLSNFTETAPLSPCSLNDEIITLQPENNWQMVAPCNYDETSLDPIALNDRMVESPGRINSDYRPLFNDDASIEVTTLPHAHISQSNHLLQSTSTSSPNSKRTRISKVAKNILVKHFRQNPYPNEDETSALSMATHLTTLTIKRWFNNTRSRTKAVTIHNYANKHLSNASPCISPAHSISSASLEALDQASPSASRSSLERYLDAPADQEALPAETLAAVLNDASIIAEQVPSTASKAVRFDIPRTLRVPRPPRSIAMSYSSGSSADSNDSVLSVDSRGSRRGRKMKLRSSRTIGSLAELQKALESIAVRRVASPERTKSPRAASPSVPLPITAADVKSLRPYFCTAADCDARFKFRWEWSRHEEALHYQPYQWICCWEKAYAQIVPECWLCGTRNVPASHFAEEHFGSCVDKAQQHRTFLREDQLLQHINGVHLKDRVTKKTCQNLLSLWKAVSATMEKAHLTCGFCDQTCGDWAERQDHVSAHIRSGFAKSAWWTPMPSWDYEDVSNTIGL